MEQNNLSLPADARVQLSANNAEELIRRLDTQNQLLREINSNLSRTLEENDDKRYSIRAHILDVNMSIGAMIGFMFKWLVASIPVAIVIGFIYFLVLMIVVGNRY